MSNIFQKLFETIEKEAKQRTVLETGIKLNQYDRPENYETSVLNRGSHDLFTWYDNNGEIKHILRHKSLSYIHLSVKPKNGKFPAQIEIKPDMEEYEQIKKSLEDRGWELLPPVRGRRTKLK